MVSVRTVNTVYKWGPEGEKTSSCVIGGGMILRGAIRIQKVNGSLSSIKGVAPVCYSASKTLLASHFAKDIGFRTIDRNLDTEHNKY